MKLRTSIWLAVVLGSWIACGGKLTTRSSVDSGRAEEAGAAGASDGTVEAPGQAVEDAAAEQEPDTGTPLDAQFEDAVVSPADAGAEAAADGSPCATFQPQPIWTPTSGSFDLDSDVSGEMCGERFHFSEADSTLFGACIAYQPGQWLVYLSETQVQAIVTESQGIQTLCEPDSLYDDMSAIGMSVQGAPPDVSPTAYTGSWPFGYAPPIETEAGVRYMDVTNAYDLEITLSDVVIAACDPDAGGGNPATCLPLDADGGTLDADDGD